MKEIFWQVLNLSLTGSFLILAVLAVRLLLRRAPRNLICILWLLVGLRFLLPVSVESPFGVMPAGEVVKDSTWQEGMPMVDTGFANIDQPINRQIQISYMTEEGEKGLGIWELCAYVWVAGMLLLLGYFVWSWYDLRKKVAMAVPEHKCGEKVYLCDAISSPFLMGIVRPRIYLPQGMAEETIPYVIAHEKAHKRRKDYLSKWIASLFLIVYWFHPLIWVSYILFSRDIEFACDEKVIHEMGTEHKKNYSNALLKCAVGKRSGFWCPAAFGEVGVKSRILKVLHYKKPAFWGILAAAALILLTAVCFLTQRKEMPREGSVIAFEGGEFILEDAVACTDTGFIRMVIRVRADETSETNVRDLYAKVYPNISGSMGQHQVGENEWEIDVLGYYEAEVADALILTRRLEGTKIGSFSPELIRYEEAKEFVIDSYAGPITILASPHSIKAFFEEGLPDKKEGGVLAIEMKDGTRWKATRVPFGTGASAMEFEKEMTVNSGTENEEQGTIILGFDTPLNLKNIQSFVLLPKK